MTRLWNIVKMEYYTIAPYTLRVVLVMLLYPAIFVFLNKSPEFGLLFVVLMMSIMSSYNFSIEEKNDMERLYAGLPIRKGDHVIGRYLFLFLFVVVMEVLSILSTLLFSLIGKMEISFTSLLHVSLIGLAIYLFIVSFQMPIFFKMGYQKARILSYLPLLLIGVGSPILIKLFQDTSGTANSLERAYQFVVQNLSFVIIVALAGTFLLYLISSLISIKFYTAKEG